MKSLLIYFSTFILVFLLACTDDTEPIDNGNKNNLSYSWQVNASITNNNDFTYGPFIIRTTSNNDSINIHDEGKFWNFQGSVALNSENMTFESASSINTRSSVGAKFRVFNGQILGSDSIAFNIQFENDETPYGITYNIKGRR